MMSNANGLRNHARAFSMLELIVVLAIIGILLGFLLIAVQRTRVSARRVENINNLHEIAIANQNYATTNGRFPKKVAHKEGSYFNTVWTSLMPYLNQEKKTIRVGDANDQTRQYIIPVFVNPSDPSLSSNLGELYTGAISYGANCQVFFDEPKPTSITDGLSNTIGFAEHYGKCGNLVFSSGSIYGSFYRGRRATFAESYTTGTSDVLDVYPLTSGNPPISSGWIGNVPTDEKPSTLTFQAAPKLTECDPSVAQGPDPAGMQIGLMDGGVRMIRANVNQHTYWALVTPRAGDIVGDY